MSYNVEDSIPCNILYRFQIEFLVFFFGTRCGGSFLGQSLKLQKYFQKSKNILQ